MTRNKRQINLFAVKDIEWFVPAMQAKSEALLNPTDIYHPKHPEEKLTTKLLKYTPYLCRSLPMPLQ